MFELFRSRVKVIVVADAPLTNFVVYRRRCPDGKVGEYSLAGLDLTRDRSYDGEGHRNYYERP